MRAAIIRKYGNNDVVELTDMPRPVAGAGDLLIRVHAASVNPIDFKTRLGKVKPLLPYKMPLILGNDLSGVVEAVGAGVTRFAVGDAVYARLDKMRIGAFAEYAVVDEKYAARKPANLSHEEAAAIPLAGLTAWQALFDVAGVKPGDKVLIHAGAGGVGTLAIQIAKHGGAHVITTTSTKNVELVKSLGADEVVDYTKEDFAQKLSGVDMVLESLGGEIEDKSWRVLKPGGVLVTIAGLPDVATAREFGASPIIRAALWFMNRRPERNARKVGARYRYLFMRPDGAQLAEMARLCEAGKLRPIVDKVYPLEDVKGALAHVESGRARGKVIVKVV